MPLYEVIFGAKSQLQNTVQPHQSADITHERANIHIKVTHPSCTSSHPSYNALLSIVMSVTCRCKTVVCRLYTGLAWGSYFRLVWQSLEAVKQLSVSASRVENFQHHSFLSCALHHCCNCERTFTKFSVWKGNVSIYRLDLVAIYHNIAVSTDLHTC